MFGDTRSQLRLNHPFRYHLTIYAALAAAGNLRSSASDGKCCHNANLAITALRDHGQKERTIVFRPIAPTNSLISALRLLDEDKHRSLTPTCVRLVPF